MKAKKPLRIDVKVLPRLYDKICEEADKVNMPICQFASILLGRVYSMPEEAWLPRMGRPRVRKRG